MQSEVYRDGASRFRWRLLAGNGHPVAVSDQPFRTRFAARWAVRRFTTRPAAHDFEEFTDASGVHRWRARAGNGRIVATSDQDFVDPTGASAAADRVRTALEQEVAVAPQGSGPASAWQPVSTWLAASALGVVGTAASIVGLADADFDRAAINFANGVPLAFLAIIVGVLLGLAAPASTRWQKRFAGAGLVFFGFGVFGLVYLAVAAKSASDRPRVQATLMATPSGQRLQGTVEGTALETNQHMVVRIVGISTDDKLSGDRIGHPREGEKPSERQPVYSSRTGAASDGTSKLKLDVPIAAGLYERLDVVAEVSDDEPADAKRGRATSVCDQEQSKIGCESIMVPPVMRRPRLSARWKLPAGKPPVLSVIAGMGDLSSDDRVLLSVRRVHGNELGGRVYGASWAPDAGGLVQENLEIPVAPRGRPVCVVLRSLRGGSKFVSEARQRFGPCRARSQGMAVYLGPPATRP